ncbi:MAG: FAD-dependent oxidoreductase [Chloroflexi bacterium]|nr:MAG: FAD-dependent oxidoreductase [Chloroflexota bacterium]
MVWNKGWRERAWSDLDQPWDLIIIGGGITGAGVFRQAVQSGLKTLLVEAHDFGSGTSSRSSKLVHGGLRYLQTAQLKLTLESVREREYLLKQGRGLVNPLNFLYARQRGDYMPGWMFGLGLCAYDLMARQWQHRSYDNHDLRELCPLLTSPKLRGGYRYFDAQTDDARLVLRLIRESVEMGGVALNYARVGHLLKTRDEYARGIALRDTSGETDKKVEVKARVVINATGVWVDELRKEIGRPARMRPLRGSHLVLQRERLPLSRAVTFLHPQDGRPVFALPWEGVILFGTTDIDHPDGLEIDPSISSGEVDYLLEGLQAVFPGQELDYQDITATFAGLRPVVNTGKSDPSKESREYAVWDEKGLITVAGGKLTTFRLMARDTLKKARRYLSTNGFNHQQPALLPHREGVEALSFRKYYSPSQQIRLLGRYSGDILAGLSAVDPLEHQPIPGTPYTWAELGEIAPREAVIHLDDLLLRRLRLGLLVPAGGSALLPQLGEVIRPALGWSDTRWNQETRAYLKLIQSAYQAG